MTDATYERVPPEGEDDTVAALTVSDLVKGQGNNQSMTSGYLQVYAFTVTGNDFSTGYGISPTIRAGADRQNTTPMVVVPVPCQVDGSPVASTLRGFGHGWQGQHNSTNAVAQEAQGE